MELWKLLILATLILTAAPAAADDGTSNEAEGQEPPCNIWVLYTNPVWLDLHPECVPLPIGP